MTAMPVRTLRDARTDLLRERVLDATCDLIRVGDEVTFAKVATAADVPERTVYRHFPNRQALISALFAHVNQRIGFGGQLPTTQVQMTAMVQQVFPGFDMVAPIVDELLSSPEGRRARLESIEQRRTAARAVVADARPDLDNDAARDIAAVVQVLGSAAVWRALRDFWDLDGAQAATAVTTAIDALLTTPAPCTEPS
jgi:AcrR family transcriptional regulator